MSNSSKRKFYIGVYEIWEQMHLVEAETKEEAFAKIDNGESEVLEDQFELVGLYEDSPYRIYKHK